MITNHMTNSLIGPILIRNSRVSAKFKLRSTGLSSEISLLRIRRETVTGLLGGLPSMHLETGKKTPYRGMLKEGKGPGDMVRSGD